VHSNQNSHKVEQVVEFLHTPRKDRKRVIYEIIKLKHHYIAQAQNTP